MWALDETARPYPQVLLMTPRQAEPQLPHLQKRSGTQAEGGLKSPLYTIGNALQDTERFSCCGKIHIT